MFNARTTTNRWFAMWVVVVVVWVADDNNYTAIGTHTNVEGLERQVDCTYVGDLCIEGLGSKWKNR